MVAAPNAVHVGVAVHCVARVSEAAVTNAVRVVVAAHYVAGASEAAVP